jgi:hypothetical protein
VSLFLTTDEIAQLTGRARKALQIDALRRMGIPFWVNAAGYPVVTRAAIEGGSVKEEPKREWRSRVL